MKWINNPNFQLSPGRTLLMLQSIKRAHRLDSNNPDLHSCVVRFLHHTGASPLEGAVAEVVKHQTRGIYSNSDAAQFNNSLLKNTNSLPHLLQCARMLYLLDPTSQSKALSLGTSLDGLTGVTLPICTRVLEALRANDFGTCDAAIDEYMNKCHKRFPYATAFRPPESKLPAIQLNPSVQLNHQDKENTIKNWWSIMIIHQ